MRRLRAHYRAAKFETFDERDAERFIGLPVTDRDGNKLLGRVTDASLATDRRTIVYEMEIRDREAVSEALVEQLRVSL